MLRQTMSPPHINITIQTHTHQKPAQEQHVALPWDGVDPAAPPVDDLRDGHAPAREPARDDAVLELLQRAERLLRGRGVEERGEVREARGVVGCEGLRREEDERGVGLRQEARLRVVAAGAVSVSAGEDWEVRVLLYGGLLGDESGVVAEDVCEWRVRVDRDRRV